jgi:hypothetical protein
MRRRFSTRRVMRAARRLFSKKTVNSEGRLPEEPSFEEVGIFYNRVFDLGDFINPTEVARKLLDEDFALAAPNYLTDEIEVATRFKRLARLQSRFRDLVEFHRNLESDGMLGAAKWTLRHPVRSWGMWWSVISAYRSSPSGDKQSAVGINDNEQSDITARNPEEMLEDTTDFIDEAMVQVGLTESLLRYVDRKLFNPQYLAEVPFTRISLQPFDVTLAGEKVGVDVGLMVHRTGVAILTFYFMFEGRKSARQLLDLELIGSKPEITELTVARAIMEPHARSYGLRSTHLDEAPFEHEFSSGVEWTTYRSEEKGTLVDIFDMYETAIVSALKGKQPTYPNEPWLWRRTPEWFIYPIVFARRVIPEVPDGTTFRRLYPKVIAGLIQRVPWQRLTEENIEGIIEEDLSIYKDYSQYMEAGHTMVLYFEPYRRRLMETHGGDDIPGQDWLHSQFQTSIIIDVLLIERWILTILNRQLDALTPDLTKLNTVKRNLLIALEEYHNIAITYGSAQNLIRRARVKMGTDELYQGVMQKLSILDRLIEVNESRRRAWRDRLLAAGTAIITALVGFPAALEITKAVAEWDTVAASEYGGWGAAINMVVRFMQVHPAMMTLTLYGIPLCIVVVLILLSFWPSRTRSQIVTTDQSRPALTEGFV